MRTDVINFLCVLAVIQLASGFQVGSRGVGELDMTRSVEDVDAGNKLAINNVKEHVPKNNEDNIKRNNNLLKKFSNKEYLFEDLVGTAEPTVIKALRTVALPKGILEFGENSGNIKESVGSMSSSDSGSGRGEVKREQRANPNNDLFNIDDFEKIAYELMKNDMNKQQEQHNTPFVPSSKLDYDFLMNQMNAEENMKSKDMREGFNHDSSLESGDSSPESSEELDSFNPNLDYSNEYQLENLYAKLLQKQSKLARFHGAEIPDEMIERMKSETFQQDNNVQKPVIHYREAFISGDLLGKKDQKEQSDLYFKTISASPLVTNYPNNAKLAKYSFDDPLHKQHVEMMKNQRDYLFVAVITGCTIAALLAILAGGVCVYTVKRQKQSGFETKKGLFNGGVTTGISKNGSIKSNSSNSSGDRRLAQSAQMFHYQHQKQQMLAMEIANKGDKQELADSSEGENDEADFTVYECPGLAPTGEMEVKNPLFKEDLNLSSTSLASMPPAYSTVTTTTTPVAPTKPGVNLVQITETAVDMDTSATTDKN